MNPFNTFGPDVFTYLKQICVQIKENIIDDVVFDFLAKYRAKKPVYEPSPLNWRGKEFANISKNYVLANISESTVIS